MIATSQTVISPSAATLLSLTVTSASPAAEAPGIKRSFKISFSSITSPLPSLGHHPPSFPYTRHKCNVPHTFEAYPMTIRYLSLHLLQDPIYKPALGGVSDGLLICWALDNVNNIDSSIRAVTLARSVGSCSLSWLAVWGYSRDTTHRNSAWSSLPYW